MLHHPVADLRLVVALVHRAGDGGKFSALVDQVPFHGVEGLVLSLAGLALPQFLADLNVAGDGRRFPAAVVLHVALQRPQHLEALIALVAGEKTTKHYKQAQS